MALGTAVLWPLEPARLVYFSTALKELCQLIFMVTTQMNEFSLVSVMSTVCLICHT